jgi:hypothetical protein
LAFISTYPDQVGAAEVWLGQNPGLKPEALQNAVNGQDWDPSVKSLAQFPNVLAQLSSNIPWTTALGRAYYNDPADVMNAIQVMRQRAYKAGTLKDSSRLKVAVATPDAAVPQPAPQAVGEPLSSMLPVPVIDTPPQLIEIAPAQPDTVYVPQYDPGVVYGEPVPMYGGYRPIVAPQPVYVGSSAVPVVAGLIGFGAGVILAESVDRRPWGWNSWGMRWGEPGYRWHRNEPPPPPSRRPAVIYNNNTYVSRSTTVVQNIHNTNVTNITNNGRWEPRRADNPPQGGDPRSGAMAAAALAGAAGMAGAAHMAGAAGPAPGMPQRLGLRPPQGGPPPSSQGMLPPGAAQGFARHDGMDHGRPGLRPDDRPQAALQPRMAPVPASQPGPFGQAGKWPQSPVPGVTQRPAPALPAAAQAGERGRDARVPSWSSAATAQGMRPQDRQDRDRSMADAARMRQQQQQQMEVQTARLRGEEQARQQQQQAQRQAQMQAQARDQAQMQTRQQAERDRQAFQQRAQDQARQQQLQQQQQQQQQARAQEQMQARMQAQQQAQQQAQRQAQMQERQAQQQRQQQFEAAQQQRMQAQARAQQQQQQQQQARAQQEQRQQQQRMANAFHPQERRGGRDERRDR